MSVNHFEGSDMGKIVNKLDELRQKKAQAEGHNITWDSIAQETGLAYTTVLRWGGDKINRYDDEALAKFCEYFGVQPGEILVYVE